MEWLLYIIIALIVIIVIPWYLTQMGRFFITGILDVIEERFKISRKGDKNGKKET